MLSVSEYLREIKRLLTLAGENPFKSRAFDRAADAMEGRDDLKDLATRGELTEIPGVGAGIAAVVSEYLLEHRTTARDELIAKLPPGLLEFTEVDGLGPKKARVLIEKLDIHSLSELEYACRENRLVELPGFGAKLQAQILESVRRIFSHRGRVRLGDVWDTAMRIQTRIGAEASSKFAAEVAAVGELARQSETLERLEFLIGSDSAKDSQGWSQTLKKVIDAAKVEAGIPIELHSCSLAQFGRERLRLASSKDHLLALAALKKIRAEDLAAYFTKNAEGKTEEELYRHFGVEFIPPEMRETGHEVTLARAGTLGHVISIDQVRGVLHNHTTGSDGKNSMLEMATEARRLGYEYLGISDHSQSAFYARGLTLDALRAQRLEMNHLQEKFGDLRLFWGVESDILADGSLDYPEEVLREFDFVVASVHSRFKMNEKEMTQRILRAVENPYTTVLGHPTGRLLLGREGYGVDLEQVMRRACEVGVAIELNANPQRLDIGWNHGAELRASGVKVCINPDAHSLDGLSDVRFGVAMARKALLPVGQILNALSAQEMATHLVSRKPRRPS